MDVYVMIMRKKTTLFLDANQDTTVGALKSMIQRILKVDIDKQTLYYKNFILEDHRTLGHYALDITNAGAHCPASFGLAVGDEPLEIYPLSAPPKSPDVMKTREATLDPTCA